MAVRKIRQGRDQGLDDRAVHSYIARQPILDDRLEVFGYELLFRSGFENVFPDVDTRHASSKVIADSALLMDPSRLVGGKRAFINVTREVVLDGYVDLLPRDATVIEILETVEPDRKLVEACRRLRAEGYPIALDDFEYREALNPLLELADIVKVDFLATEPEAREAIAERLRGSGVRLLAEKVETHRMVAEARSMGYELFQGFFFAEPEIVAARDVPGFKLNLLGTIREIHRPELDFDGLERVIKRDVALTYKLLRYINTVHFGFRAPIGSIRHALVLLGEREVRKWATLIAITGIGEDRPPELVHQALIRARFCESLADPFRLGARSQDLFLLGLFSPIDALLGRPLDEILESLPIEEDVKAALLGLDSPVRPVLAFSEAYERGDWDTANRVGPVGGEAVAGRLYLEALDWGAKSINLAIRPGSAAGPAGVRR